MTSRLKTPTALIIALSFLVSIGTYREIHDVVAHDRHNVFVGGVNVRVSAIESSIKQHLFSALSLKYFFESSDTVSREDFRNFTGPMESSLDGVRALEWIPRIPNPLRARYVEKAKLDGLSDYVIKEKKPDLGMVKADVRDEYYPVYYVEPLSGNEGAVGFDLGSNPARLQALEQARDTGKQVLSSGITLVQSGTAGVLAFVPIYKSKETIETVDQRREHLLGFGLGVYDVEKMIAAAYRKRDGMRVPAGIDFYIFDDDNNSKDLLYIHHSRARESKSAPVMSFDEALTGHFHLQNIKVAGRTWTIIGRAIPSNPVNDIIWDAWIALIIIGLITIGLILLLQRYRENQRRTQEQVTLKTQELSISEDNSASILGAVPDGIITIDNTGEIQSANQAMETVFGYKVEALVGMKVQYLMPEINGLDHSRYLRNIEVGGSKPFLETMNNLEGMRKSGKTFPMEVTVTEFRAANQTLFMEVIRDISEQKEVDRMKGEFLSSINHELRTPLTVILGYLPMLTNLGLMPEPDGVVKIAAKMEKSAKHLLSIVNDILDISKIESGDFSYNYEVIETQSIIEWVMDQYTAEAENKGLSLTSNVESTEIETDLTRVRQIIVNLVGNAIKFTEEGAIDISVRTEGEAVIFTVKDTGRGIAEDRLEMIFDRFKQVDGSSTRSVDGTGLGLAIVKHLVGIHGGSVHVESVVGQGSSFAVSLPKKQSFI